MIKRCLINDIDSKGALVARCHQYLFERCWAEASASGQSISVWRLWQRPTGPLSLRKTLSLSFTSSSNLAAGLTYIPDTGMCQTHSCFKFRQPSLIPSLPLHLPTCSKHPLFIIPIFISLPTQHSHLCDALRKRNRGFGLPQL